jgi:hypothetical protein
VKPFLRKCAEFLLPSVYSAFVNRRIASNSAQDPSEPPETLVGLLEGKPDLQDEARDLYVEEAGRLAGIEAKSRALTTYISIATPFVVSALGAGLTTKDWPASVLAGIAAIHLVLALALSVRSVATSPVHVLRQDDLLNASNAESETGAWLGARRLQITELNEPIGWQRQNAVSAGRASLIWVFVLVSASGLRFLLIS